MLEVPSRSSGNTRAPHCNWAPSVLPVEVHVSSSASHSQSGLEFLEAILSKHPDQSGMVRGSNLLMHHLL